MNASLDMLLNIHTAILFLCGKTGMTYVLSQVWAGSGTRGKVRPREGLSLEGFYFDVFLREYFAHTHLVIREILLSCATVGLLLTWPAKCNKFLVLTGFHYLLIHVHFNGRVTHSPRKGNFPEHSTDMECRVSSLLRSSAITKKRCV